MRIIFSLYLMLMTCALFAAEEEQAPIWQQGTVLLIQVISFLILIYCIYKFLFRPITEEMEQRQSQIENAYRDAEESKKFCEEKKAEYEEMIKHADKEVQQKLAEAVKEANSIKDKKLNEAAQEAKRKLELAENTIQNEKEKAAFELRKESGRLGVKIASKILNEKIDENKHKELVDEFIKGLDA